MFSDPLEDLARLGRQAMVALAWILLVIALALATRASITSARAQGFDAAAPALAGVAPGLDPRAK